MGGLAQPTVFLPLRLHWPQSGNQCFRGHNKFEAQRSAKLQTQAIFKTERESIQNVLKTLALVEMLYCLPCRARVYHSPAGRIQILDLLLAFKGLLLLLLNHKNT